MNNRADEQAKRDAAYRAVLAANEKANLPTHPRGPDLPDHLAEAVKAAGLKPPKKRPRNWGKSKAARFQ